MCSDTDVDDLDISVVVDTIIEFHQRIEREWSKSGGWAPRHAAKLLAESRLDWLASLAHTLRLWTENEIPVEQEGGQLILAWANLGAIVEGSMKFLLSIGCNRTSALPVQSEPG